MINKETQVTEDQVNEEQVTKKKKVVTDSIFKVVCSSCGNLLKVRSSVYLKRLNNMPHPNKEYLDSRYTCRNCRREKNLTALGNPKKEG